MSRIALVEDDPDMLKLLQTFLEIEGFQAVAYQVDAGQDVLDFLRTCQADILLMDVHLPWANGLDLLPAIRQDPLVGHCYIVMSSGMDLRDRCLSGGADAFLLKPYMPGDLIRLVRRYGAHHKIL